jgi:hypothetical protein
MTDTMTEPISTRNLAVNPACSVSVRLRGIDLVLEGEARSDSLVCSPPSSSGFPR